LRLDNGWRGYLHLGLSDRPRYFLGLGLGLLCRRTLPGASEQGWVETRDRNNRRLKFRELAVLGAIIRRNIVENQTVRARVEDNAMGADPWHSQDDRVGANAGGKEAGTVLDVLGADQEGRGGDKVTKAVIDLASETVERLTTHDWGERKTVV
jgi:hypothetical protein